MFGLCPSASVFTKMMAAVIGFLRKTFNILLVAYIDPVRGNGGSYSRYSVRNPAPPFQIPDHPSYNGQ